MDLDFRKIVVRGLLGLALAGVFAWQCSHRRRRAAMSIRPGKKS